MPVRRSLAGALTAPLLILSACGGSSSVADPPVSPSAPSPSADPPRHETPEAFIRRWANAEQAMQNTGRTQRYLTLSRGCRACHVLARTVARYYARGGFVHWEGWDIRSIRHYPSAADSLSFQVRSDSAPTVYRTSGGSPEQHLPGGDITYILTLKPASGPFHVSAKAQLDQ